MRKMAGSHDTLYLKFVSPANSGVPDRILIHNGIITFVELKAPGEKPRKLQEKQIEKLRKHGATVKVIDSIEAVDAYFLKQMEKDLDKRFERKNRIPSCQKFYERSPYKT